jgi:hypothetical protein
MNIKEGVFRGNQWEGGKARVISGEYDQSIFYAHIKIA